jgi:hypothetical protein
MKNSERYKQVAQFKARLRAIPPALASKANDLEALRSAVIDAASVGAGFWLSYLFVLFYLLIAVGGVRHRDLFFENPVKLPFLNVELPLVEFFGFGPLMFLIVHAYVLLHFVLLADKVEVFHSELKAKSTKSACAPACVGSYRAISLCSFSLARASCARDCLAGCYGSLPALP